jgi:hypothetical protein
MAAEASPDATLVAGPPCDEIAHVAVHRVLCGIVPTGTVIYDCISNPRPGAGAVGQRFVYLLGEEPCGRYAAGTVQRFLDSRPPGDWDALAPMLHARDGGPDGP